MSLSYFGRGARIRSPHKHITWAPAWRAPVLGVEQLYQRLALADSKQLLVGEALRPRAGAPAELAHYSSHNVRRRVPGCCARGREKVDADAVRVAAKDTDVLLDTRKRGVKKIAELCGSGSRSGARQCESALMI